MTTVAAPTVFGGDPMLKRIDTGLKYATGLLTIPAVIASQGHLPFAPWVIAPLLIVMTLWIAVSILVDVGQRVGLVGTKLFPKSSPPAASGAGFEASKREAAPVVRRADDAVPPPSRAADARPRVHVAHVPGRGDVRFRIRSAN